MSATARIVRNADVYVAEWDMSGDENEVNLSVNADAKECTVMGDSAHVFKPGLITVELGVKGYNAWALTGAVDDYAFAKTGATVVPMTLVPDTTGTRAFILQATGLQFENSYKVGEFPTFSLSYKNNGSVPVIAGTLLYAGAIASFPYNSTGVQCGALSASQKAYATLHIMSVTGSGTLTVNIQNAATQGGTYTTRGSFTGAAAKGSQWLTPISGALADTWWRVNATVTGFTGATIAVGFGIL